MGILSNLFDRLRNRGKPATAEATPTAQAAAPADAAQPAQPAQPMQPAGTVAQAAAPAAQPVAAAPAAPAVTPLSDVDMAQVLEELAARNPQKLNWRTSIVDLMKLLGMDSSLQERKALAQELGYTGDRNDSAAMNIWLHKQVMREVAANGGKVPADLLD